MVSLGNSASKGKVTLAMVRNSLFNEEIGRKNFVGNDTYILVTENRGQSRNQESFEQNKSSVKSEFREKIK